VTLLLALALAMCTQPRSETNEQRDADVVVEQYFLQSTESFHVLCMDDDTRERIRNIMLKAIDEALQQQVENLFLTWLKDSTGQPARARQGVRNAIEAYLAARKGALKWSPMQC
jgi:hypothetical protein